MSQFSVVLPSDASMDYYPDNTVAHYKTKLAYPICNDGDYEVALMELIYPNNYHNFILKEPLLVQYPLTLYERQQTSTRPEDHDRRVGPGFRFRWQLESGFFKNEQALVNYINAELLKLYKKIYDGEFDEPFLQYDEKTRFMTFSLSGMTRERGRDINNKEIVGVDERVEKRRINLKAGPAGLSKAFIKRFNLKEEHYIINKKPFEFDGDGYRLMYVYSDIVTPYLVGDVQAPLLRTIAPSSKRGEMITTTFTKPYYVPVARRGIDTIQIHINSELGEPMPFTGGKSLAVLHFRRRNESFLSDFTK